MSEQQEHIEASDSSAGYEKKDVNVAWLLGVAAAIVAFVVVSVILLNEFFLISKEEMIYDVALRPESQALRELQAREAEVLGSYGVINGDSAIYRIPIARAVQLEADEAYRARVGEK
ncbi:MAG: hypothetical protein ABIJ61_02675 [bacterium]